MYIDTHTHSLFSYDADYPLETMIKAAEDAGLSVLAVTDHCDMERLCVDQLYETMPKAARALIACREKQILRCSAASRSASFAGTSPRCAASFPQAPMIW